MTYINIDIGHCRAIVETRIIVDDVDDGNDQWGPYKLE